MFKCLKCGQDSAIWSSIYETEDLGYENPGTISLYACVKCNSTIEVIIFEERGILQKLKGGIG